MQYARKQHAATADGSPAEVPALSYSSRTSLKMCRYGKGCTRKDCKFRHEGDFARYVFCAIKVEYNFGMPCIWTCAS